jgi:hypothetical protein
MNRRRLALIAIIVVVVFVIFSVGATLLFNSGGGASSVGTISSVSYSQTKAVQGWDDSTHTMTDAGQLSELQKVLAKNNWSPNAKVDSNSMCAGGLATTLAMTFSNNSRSTLRVYECGRDSGALATDVTSLVSSWRGHSS